MNTEAQLAPSGDQRKTSIHDVAALFEQDSLALGQALEKLPQRDQQAVVRTIEAFLVKAG